MSHSLGIDVSRYQPALDWPRIKSGGFDFVYVRYGHGDGTGDSGKDSMFDSHFYGAKEAGLLVGAYWYMWSTNAVEQARLFAQLNAAECDMPMAVDIEQSNITEASIKLFLTELKRLTGRRPLIYTRQNLLDGILGSSNRDWLREYDLWTAEYPEVVGEYPTRLPKGYSNWQFWQFTSEGRVPGYSGNIDINYFNGSLEDLCCRYRIPDPEDAPLRWPVNSSVVTQIFGANPSHYGPLLGAPGMGHEGIDLRAGLNDPIYACADGILADKFYDESYGYLVILDHQNGFKTLYAHMARLSSIAIGTRVKAGDRIGDAGTTGASTGTHLHLTLYYDDAEKISVYPKKPRGYLINPTPYLQPIAVSPVGVQMRNSSGLVLNIRELPSISSADLGDIPTDAIVTAYPPETNGYLSIDYQGIKGFALAKQFSAIEATAVWLRSTAQPFVNIRSEPSVSSTDLGDLPFGEQILGYPVAGQAFWKVIHNGNEAWISSAWLEIV